MLSRQMQIFFMYRVAEHDFIAVFEVVGHMGFGRTNCYKPMKKFNTYNTMKNHRLIHDSLLTDFGILILGSVRLNVR